MKTSDKGPVPAPLKSPESYPSFDTCIDSMKTRSVIIKAMGA